MNQQINTGIYELTSNNDHIYIEGTEENDIELLSLIGNTEYNINSCTYNRFREGLDAHLYYCTGDYYNKYLTIYGTRFIYDSKGEIHESVILKQGANIGGLHNILPTQLKNQDTINMKIRIYENTLDSTDTAKIQFMNMNWDIKSLEPGEHTNAVKMTVASTATWLLNSYGRPEFLNLSITNSTENNKKLDFEILEISLQNDIGVYNSYEEFQTLELERLTIQEGSLNVIDEYILSNDAASRLNIINNKILDIEKRLL